MLSKEVQKAADIIKTAVNKKAKNVTYMNAYRGIINEFIKDISDEDSFQLVIPFVKRLKQLNDQSVVEWELDDNNRLQ
jgi:hypothetical protein